MFVPRAARAALLTLLAATVTAGAQEARRDSIPLPEHPRPDFERAEWLNLNGRWDFAFDARDEGERAGWSGGQLPSPRPILVPFSWGAPASGVPDSAEIGWYARSITIPQSWRGRRVYLVVGASDWRTTVWLDGTKVGEHQGGYVPFSVELTQGARYGTPQRVTLRVDDRPHPFKLEGKQGYGQARGMWQTVYLEARGSTPLASLHFTPDLRRGVAVVDARLAEPAARDVTLRVVATNVAGAPAAVQRIRRGATSARLELKLPNARLWSLEDPFLHEVSATVSGTGVLTDSVRTYFGMRTISVTDLPGTKHPYVAINGKPVFLQLALDQAYHPTGYYTFPSDSFTRMEILRARQIGLNGLREHIKIETPRKL
jgi:beta-galactosidase/beta-glucuronidase